MVAWKHLLPPSKLSVTVPLGRERRHLRLSLELCAVLGQRPFHRCPPLALAAVLVTVLELAGETDCVQRLRLTVFVRSPL